MPAEVREGFLKEQFELNIEEWAEAVWQEKSRQAFQAGRLVYGVGAKMHDGVGM